MNNGKSVHSTSNSWTARRMFLRSRRWQSRSMPVVAVPEAVMGMAGGNLAKRVTGRGRRVTSWMHARFKWHRRLKPQQHQQHSVKNVFQHHVLSSVRAQPCPSVRCSFFCIPVAILIQCYLWHQQRLTYISDGIVPRSLEWDFVAFNYWTFSAVIPCGCKTVQHCPTAHIQH